MSYVCKSHTSLSSTLHWPELSHMVPLNCKGDWEMSSSYKSKGEREHGFGELRAVRTTGSKWSPGELKLV